MDSCATSLSLLVRGQKKEILYQFYLVGPVAKRQVQSFYRERQVVAVFVNVGIYFMER